MNAEHIISIAITFLFGLAVGMILYLSSGLSFDFLSSIVKNQADKQLVIVGEQYGECEPDCQQFRLEADGTYRFLYTPDMQIGRVVRDGTLPTDLAKKIKQAITSREIQSQSKPISVTGGCKTSINGVNVRYQIKLGGEEYLIDSCLTAVVPDSQLWLGLDSIWLYLTRTEATTR